MRALAKLPFAFAGTVLGLGLSSALAAAVLKSRLPDLAEPEDDLIELAVIYGGRDFRSTATAFRGGRLVCWYGGANVDLRGARLADDGADLLVWTVFGGTSIRVPPDWRVELRGTALFGGAEGPTPPAGPSVDGPVLRIRHRTLFGGVGVSARPGEETVGL